MDTNEKVRSIRLPEYLWDALDADAARCRRSSQKQIEALLVTLYGVGDVEINKQQLEFIGEVLPSGKKEVSVIDMEISQPEKQNRQKAS